jgi:hypothetical protein
VLPKTSSKLSNPEPKAELWAVVSNNSWWFTMSTGAQEFPLLEAAKKQWLVKT